MKKKRNGNIQERFIQAVKCATCPHETEFFLPWNISTEQDSLSVTLILWHENVAYSKYFAGSDLLKVEQSEELVTFADREIRMGISGILHIEKNSPFAEKPEWLEGLGTLVVTYSGEGN